MREFRYDRQWTTVLCEGRGLLLVKEFTTEKDKVIASFNMITRNSGWTMGQAIFSILLPRIPTCAYLPCSWYEWSFNLVAFTLRDPLIVLWKATTTSGQKRVNPFTLTQPRDAWNPVNVGSPKAWSTEKLKSRNWSACYSASGSIFQRVNSPSGIEKGNSGW